jgi:glucan 1,3-beta-glucosidase
MYATALLVLSTLGLAAPTTRRQLASTPQVTSETGLTFFTTDLNTGASLKSPDSYTCYGGPASNFPAQSEWASFNDLWTVQSSTNLNANGNTPADISNLHDSILEVSAAAKVDARVILAMIIQESAGNLHVGCTNNGVENCGIMVSTLMHFISLD